MSDPLARDLTAGGIARVRAQLPRQLEEKLLVLIVKDVFSLRIKARFVKVDTVPMAAGHGAPAATWECVLEPGSFKIPDEFLARLCLEVI